MLSRSLYCQPTVLPSVSEFLRYSSFSRNSTATPGSFPSCGSFGSWRKQLDWEQLTGLERKVRPKKFKCDECGAAFSNNGQLRGHIRIHTGIIM